MKTTTLPTFEQAKDFLLAKYGNWNKVADQIGMPVSTLRYLVEKAKRTTSHGREVLRLRAAEHGWKPMA